jgi:hypothetical protein
MASPAAGSKQPAALFLLCLVAVALTAGAGGASAATFLVTNLRVENGQFLSRSVPTVFPHYAFVPVFTEL